MRYILHPVTLSVPPNLRMSGGPRFQNVYLEDGAGNTQCVAEWQKALWRWTLMFKKGRDDLNTIAGFFLGRHGNFYGWLFDDPSDRTNSDNGGEGLVKTLPDGKRYLVKRYRDVDNYNPYERVIRCPIPGTVSVSGVGGSPQVNHFTGEITGATGDGTATFQFRNPVVFVTDVLDLQRNAGNAPGEWSSVEIMELRRFRLPT